jgi:uncharacterized protein (DUF305 family)
VADTASSSAARPTLNPRARTSFIAILIGVLALAMGFGAGVFVAKPQHPGDASAEAGFARDMSNHHGQAVSMAIEEYQATADPALRPIAVDMALTQQAQIGIMQTWLRTWGLEANSGNRPMAWMGAPVAEGELMPGMANEAERTKLRQATGREKDILFCQLMLRHHLGGIHMVDGVLSRTDDEQVRDLAQSMKDAQQFEVGVLRKKLTALGAKP